jgi:hypothetical protein
MNLNHMLFKIRCRFLIDIFRKFFNNSALEYSCKLAFLVLVLYLDRVPNVSISLKENNFLFHTQNPSSSGCLDCNINIISSYHFRLNIWLYQSIDGEPSINFQSVLKCY